MSSYQLSPAGQKWIDDFGAIEEGGLVIKGILEESVQAFVKLEKNDRLLLLHQMSISARSQVLRQLSGVDRDATVFGGDPKLMLDVQLHDVGPEFDYDWEKFKGDGFSRENIHGLMIMARRAYELQGADGSDQVRVGEGYASFAEAGFNIHFYGRDGTNKIFNSTQAFIATKNDYAILTFRGSTFSPFSLDDFLADAFVLRTAGYFGRVHSGFAKALEEIWETLRADLQKLAVTGIKYLHITGHSLGASLSYLAARRVVDEIPEIKLVEVIPFAAARVFDSEAAEAYSAKLGAVTWRVVNLTDIVPMIPPRAIGFRHPRSHVIYVDSDGLLRLDPTQAQIDADHNINNWDESRFLKSIKSTKNPSLAWIDPLRMHGPMAYLQPIYINTKFLEIDGSEALALIDKYLSFSTRSTHLEAATQYLLPLNTADRDMVVKYLPKVYAKPLLKWLTEEHIVQSVRHYIVATRRSAGEEEDLINILSSVRQQLGRRVIKRTFSIFSSEG